MKTSTLTLTAITFLTFLVDVEKIGAQTKTGGENVTPPVAKRTTILVRRPNKPKPPEFVTFLQNTNRLDTIVNLRGTNTAVPPSPVTVRYIAIQPGIAYLYGQMRFEDIEQSGWLLSTSATVTREGKDNKESESFTFPIGIEEPAEMPHWTGEYLITFYFDGPLFPD